MESCESVEKIMLVDRQHRMEDTNDLVSADMVEITKSLELLRNEADFDDKWSRLQDIQASHVKGFKTRTTQNDYYILQGNEQSQVRIITRQNHRLLCS